MSNVISILLILAVAIQCIGTVVYLIQVSRLLRRLESKHCAVHESLGSQTLVLNNTPQNARRLVKWLWRREFEKISDLHTVALAKQARTLLVWVGGNCLLTFFLFALFSASIGRVAT
jgi:hypothetical protein